MKKSIRILLVEDSLSDAQLILANISGSDIGFTKEIVDTKEDYISALKSFVPDLIISDFSVPQFDGMTALLIRNDVAPDTPFLIVSDAQSAEIAVECMKAGVDDYIIKPNLSRLGEAIRSAINKMEIIKRADKDITRRKYAEEMLKHSEEKFNKAFHNSPDAIIIARSSDGMITEINEVFEKISGYPREEIIGMTTSDLNLWVNANDDDHFISVLEQKRRVTDFKSLFKTKLNAIRNVSLSGEFYEVNGENYILAIIHDITEQLKSEEALKKSEARFRSYFDLSGVGVAITSPSTGWVEVNDKLCRMLGYSSEEIYKSTWPQLTHPDDLDIDMENFAQVISGKIDEYSLDKRFLRKDGETIWTNLSVRCVRNQTGLVNYFVALIFDITERKRVETELIKAKLKAEESDRLKTAFLHNVSHEIRTPLNAILGFGALLSEPGLSPDEQASYMETIREGSDQLLSIISTIVDISSAEAKVLKKNVTSFNLNTTLKSLLKQFQLKAPENSNSLNMKPGLNDEDAFILSDSVRFMQIISNLLNNALKFTKNGSVDFGYTVNDKMIEFYVRDTGIGIPSDELNKIFGSFYQIESTLARNYGGTGLGLSICKAYVELLGGKIWVTSEISVGSTFYFNLPYDKYVFPSPIKPIEKKKDEIKEKASHVILVAEDDETNFKLISIYLSDQIVTILRAHDGQEAVDICKSRKDIDLILMDINMPVMDGYTATRLIRAFRPDVLVIAQTAYSDDKIEALRSGCVEFIAKPFKKTDFLKILNEHLVK